MESSDQRRKAATDPLNRGGMMANAPKEESQTRKTGRIKRQFDGIQFLWKEPETRYILKLIALVFGFMVISFAVLSTGVAIMPDQLYFLVRCTAYAMLFSIAFLFFILIQLFQSYRKRNNFKSFSERNPAIKMKLWPPERIRRHGSMILAILLIVSISIIVVEGEFFNYDLGGSIIDFVIFTLDYPILMYFMVFLTALMAIRSSIWSVNAKFAEKIHHKQVWFFLLLPVPWILFIVTFLSAGIALQLMDIVGIAVAFWWFSALFVFGFLCFMSVIALFVRRIRGNYTTSQIAVISTFLAVIVIPGIIGSMHISSGSAGFSGPVISLIIMIVLYFRATLDGMGDNLREYYGDWNKKLKQFNINTKEDILNKKYDKSFESTPLDTKVPNAYRNSMLGLLVLLLTYFGVIYLIGPFFSMFGTVVGVQEINVFLFNDSFWEDMGFSVGVGVFTVFSVFRRAKKQKVPEPPQPKTTQP